MSPRSLMTGLAALMMALPALAHEGHDHAAPPPSQDGEWAPRAEARSNDFDLVVIHRGAHLEIWLDRAADNAPVTAAQVDVEVGDWTGRAVAEPEGFFHLDAPPLARSGRHALVFTIQAGDSVDLLPVTLVVPEAAATAAGIPPAFWRIGSGLGVLCLASGATWLWARRRERRAVP
ncbi:hypothetical protein [Zoogloea sp.]|uniref:hypothetical protein n=1 Tax=Zoogloea sp. TaxID=49181 RepID=UPI00260445BF|nr:hypothetical protein [Zoogloea sp.]MDD3352180.1 hypothetical protein [Zoogloea sp.]